MNPFDVEVCIPTRGKVLAALAGLVPHAAYGPFMLRIITENPLVDPAEWRLIEMIQRLGCRVRVELQTQKGNGGARAQAGFNTDAKAIVSLDDDAVLSPPGAIPILAGALLGDGDHGWVTPVIRFVQGFTDPPAGHTEIWSRVSEIDPRVQNALEHQGNGWVRTFDTGHWNATRDLGGTCYAVRPESLRKHADELRAWNPLFGGVDKRLGQLLVRGTVVPNMFAYHFGLWSPQKWGHLGLLNTIWGRWPSTVALAATGRDVMP